MQDTDKPIQQDCRKKVTQLLQPSFIHPLLGYPSCLSMLHLPHLSPLGFGSNMPSLPRKPTRVRNSHPSQQLLRCAHFPRLRGFFCPQVLVRAVGAVGLDVSPLRRDFGCPTPDGLTRFWGARPVTHSLFTEDRAVGMETSVPQRPPLGPLTSTEKSPSSRASHRRGKGRYGQLRSSQASRGRSSGRREEGHSEPRAAQQWGPPGLR